VKPYSKKICQWCKVAQIFVLEVKIGERKKDSEFEEQCDDPSRKSVMIQTTVKRLGKVKG